MRAPVVVFVYNRPEHTKQCIEGLANCNLSKETDLFIFSDGPKNNIDKPKVKRVREYLNSISNKDLFKSVTINNSNVNKGLANSVIFGVTKIINKYDRVIVVEDDTIPSIIFLEYMNECLDLYENHQKIGAIGGFAIPIKLPKNLSDDVFLMNRGSSYAWATWKRTWDKVDWEVKDYPQFKFNFKKRKSFNKYGNNKAMLLDRQMLGLDDSWAIRFSYAIYKNDLLWVMPKVSKVTNIGLDGSGTHNKVDEKYVNIKIDEGSKELNLGNAAFNKEIAREYHKHFKISFMYRALSFIKIVILKKK